MIPKKQAQEIDYKTPIKKTKILPFADSCAKKSIIKLTTGTFHNKNLRHLLLQSLSVMKYNLRIKKGCSSNHLRLKSAKNAPQDFKTPATAVTCAHNQWWHSKKERNISACAVTCAQNQWRKHSTTLKHLPQQSIVHKIKGEIFNEKYQKISVLLQQPTYSEINDNKYTSYNNLRNLLRQLLSCKNSYKIQLKTLKYLAIQSLAKSIENKKMRSKIFSHSHAAPAKSTIKCNKG